MRKHLALVAVLGIAAIARFWAIDFCLPSPRCRPDEEAVVALSLSMFGRDLNPHFFDWPPLFIYAVTLAMVPYFNFGRFTGGIRSEFRFIQTMSADPMVPLLIARVISALAGVASVMVVYRLATRLFDRLTAHVAALFLALAFLHVRDSHFGVTDVSATLLALTALLFAIRLAESGDHRDLIAAAALTALAATTKYNAIFIAASTIWVVLTEQRHPVGQRVRRVFGFVAIVAGGFFAIAPFSLIEFDAFMQSMTNVSAHLAGGHGPEVGRGWSVHIRSSLRYGVGLPMLLTGVAGLLALTWRRPRVGVAVLLFPLATYLAVGHGRTVFARYALPIVPFICLGAAHAVMIVSELIAQRLSRPRLRSSIALALAIVVIAPSAWSVVQLDRLLAIDDSRVVAARWIAEQFPGGATIAEAERLFDRLHFPGSDRTRYPTIPLTATVDPDVIVISESLLHANDPQPVITPEQRGRYRLAMQTTGPLPPGAIYDWQDEFYVPLSGFAGIERPGPRLSIYIRR